MTSSLLAVFFIVSVTLIYIFKKKNEMKSGQLNRKQDKYACGNNNVLPHAAFRFIMRT